MSKSVVLWLVGGLVILLSSVMIGYVVGGRLAQDTDPLNHSSRQEVGTVDHGSGGTEADQPVSVEVINNTKQAKFTIDQAGLSEFLDDYLKSRFDLAQTRAVRILVDNNEYQTTIYKDYRNDKVWKTSESEKLDDETLEIRIGLGESLEYFSDPEILTESDLTTEELFNFAMLLSIGEELNVGTPDMQEGYRSRFMKTDEGLELTFLPFSGVSIE